MQTPEIRACWGHENWHDPDVIFEVYGQFGAGLEQLQHEPHFCTNCMHFKARDWNDTKNHQCCGDNGFVMFQMSLDPYAWHVLHDVKVKVNDWMEQPIPRGKPLRHGLFCAHGRHRSVASANLARFCLESEGLKVNIELFTTAKCGCPYACKKLKHLKNTDSYQKEAIAKTWMADGCVAVQNALRIWHHS